MRVETAKLIVEAGRADGIDVRLSEGYSGRGMFGKTTAAVTADSQSDLLRAVARATLKLHAAANCDQEVESFLEEMGGLRKDAMGLGVVYY